MKKEVCLDHVFPENWKEISTEEAEPQMSITKTITAIKSFFMLDSPLLLPNFLKLMVHAKVHILPES